MYSLPLLGNMRGPIFRIRPRKRKEMGLTYIVICIDLLRFALIVILFWLNRHAQHIGNAQQNL